MYCISVLFSLILSWKSFEFLYIRLSNSFIPSIDSPIIIRSSAYRKYSTLLPFSASYLMVLLSISSRECINSTGESLLPYSVPYFIGFPFNLALLYIHLIHLIVYSLKPLLGRIISNRIVWFGVLNAPLKS